MTVPGVLALLPAVIVSIIESLGDYYAVARLTGVPPPPPYAVNRAVFIEGVGSIFAAAFGTAWGITSFSSNIGLIGITKVLKEPSPTFFF